MGRAPSIKWTREHFLIALNLYCKLPFGRLHKTNPIIIEVASKLGRSANSLAMKLCNFASLDPVLQEQGKKGLPGATPQDRRVWNEFRENVGVLGPESEQLLHDLFTKDESRDLDFLQQDRPRLVHSSENIFHGPTESKALAKVRRGQQFFRQSILVAYDVRCCISGINVPRLLVASHIKPWSECNDTERTNPRNGLCLSSIHDAAFDSYLITLDDRLRVVVSKKLKGYLPQPALENNFLQFDGQKIRMPEKFALPAPEFLAMHRKEFATRSR